MAFPNGWRRRQEIVIDPNKVDSDLTDFPVLLTKANLPPEMLDSDNTYSALNGGGDIRVTSDHDGTTQLPVEVVTCVVANDGSQEAEIWTRIPSISSSEPTSFYVWYNKAGVSQPAVSHDYGRNAVWANGYVGVWHLGESSGTALDSTGRGHDGTFNGDLPDNVTAPSPSQIGGGQDCDGTGDYITVTDHADFHFGSDDFTLESWWSRGANQDSDIISSGAGANRYLIRNVTGATFRIEIDDNTTAKTAEGGSLSFETWHYVSGIRDGNTLRARIDNAEVDTEDITGYGDTDDSNTLYIGAATVGNREAHGGIDEARISNVARSAAWCNACYESQNNPFAFASNAKNPEAPTFNSHFPAGWGRRQEIIIDPNKVDEDLRHFPVLLTEKNLPVEMLHKDNPNHAINGGGDIRISADPNGSERLPVEVVNFVVANDTTKAAEIWTKLPFISSSEPTSFYVWYKKAGAVQPAVTDRYGRNAVWNGFDLVAHLEEDVNGTTDEVVDSTGNGNDGTSVGTMDSNDSVQGPFGSSSGALEFDGSDDYLDFVGYQQDRTGDYCLSFWWQSNDGNLTRSLVGDYSGTAANTWLSSKISTDGIMDHIVDDGVGQTSANFDENLDANTSTWYLVHLRRTGSTIDIAVDGVSKDTATEGADVSPSVEDMALGWSRSNNKSPDKFDEFRCRTSFLSDAWIKAEYENQNNPFAFASNVKNPETPSLSTGRGTPIRIRRHPAAYQGVDWQNPISRHSLNHQLVGWWKTFGPQGAKLRSLVSPVHDFTLVNTPTWTRPNTRSAWSSLDFETSNSEYGKAEHPHADGTTTGQITVSVRFKAESNVTWGTLLKAWGNASNERQFHLGLENTDQDVSIYIKESDDTQIGPVQDTVQITLGEWYIYTFTADGSDLRLYRNGLEVGTSAAYDGTLKNISSLSTILGLGVKLDDGGTPGSTPGYWDGEIESIRMWSRGLSAREVWEDYQDQLNHSAKTLNRRLKAGIGRSMTPWEVAEEAIIADLTSAQSESTGWNELIRDADPAELVFTREDDLNVTAELSGAVAAYDIAAQEVITGTVAKESLQIASEDVIAEPTFTIDHVPAGTGTGGETLVAASGSYTLTGTDAGLEKGWYLTSGAGVGSYTLTGTDVTFQKGWYLTGAPESGSYTLTGTDASLLKGWYLTGAPDSGSYTLTGQDAGLTEGATLSADPGSYTLTGTDATFQKGWAISADAGSYTLTGTAAGLEKGWYLTDGAGVGSYVLTGTDAGLSKGAALTAESGSYALTGTDVTLNKTWILTCAVGAYTLTGQDVTLTPSSEVVTGGQWVKGQVFSPGYKAGEVYHPGFKSGEKV